MPLYVKIKTKFYLSMKDILCIQICTKPDIFAILKRI